MEDGDDAGALEASLIENFARLDPDEVSQWETFSRLIKEGRGVADIAATFGITELLVKRILALGDLLPKIREAYRREDIDAETARHLTMSPTAMSPRRSRRKRRSSAIASRARTAARKSTTGCPTG